MNLTEDEIKVLEERKNAIKQWIQENISVALSLNSINAEVGTCKGERIVLDANRYHIVLHIGFIYRDIDSKQLDNDYVVALINNWKSVKASLIAQLHCLQDEKAKALSDDFEV